MPDSARVWVFAATQPLLGSSAERVLATVRDFLAGWHAHGAPVIGGCELREDHFLLVAADEESTGVSGCSIDSLYDALKEIERAEGITILDASPIWFRDPEGQVRLASRADFREFLRRGEVGPSTRVFDNTVGTMEEVRNGGWERPLNTSWHARAFAAR